MRYDVAIIGAGPAGILAAISASRIKKKAVLLEKNSSIGRKILVTGAGRCNLLNDNLSAAYYNPAAHSLVKSIFSKFGKVDILNFFKNIGLEVYSQNGRIFPVTNQASSVLKILDIELKRLSIHVELNFDVTNILDSRNSFIIKAKSAKSIESTKLILACGGKTYPAQGATGSLYPAAIKLGHSIIEPVPSAVPIVVKDKLCHFLQGQKIFAKVKCIVEGKTKSETSGELLFTKYGLSGTCILDVSEEISVAINRQHHKNVSICVDMVPFMDKDVLRNELVKRIDKGISSQELLVGILPNKFSLALKDLLEIKDINATIDVLKEKFFKVIGTRGWNEAEFTCGGIAVNGVKPDTLESKFSEGLYFAGEMLDVNGRCGGYNLAWAWASGFVAGQIRS